MNVGQCWNSLTMYVSYSLFQKDNMIHPKSNYFNIHQQEGSSSSSRINNNFKRQSSLPWMTNSLSTFWSMNSITSRLSSFTWLVALKSWLYWKCGLPFWTDWANQMTKAKKKGKNCRKHLAETLNKWGLTDYSTCLFGTISFSMDIILVLDDMGRFWGLLHV